MLYYALLPLFHKYKFLHYPAKKEYIVSENVKYMLYH